MDFWKLRVLVWIESMVWDMLLIYGLLEALDPVSRLVLRPDAHGSASEHAQRPEEAMARVAERDEIKRS